MISSPWKTKGYLGLKATLVYPEGPYDIFLKWPKSILK